MRNKFSRVALGLMVAGSAALTCMNARADNTVTLPDLGVNASDYTTGMASSVGPWIAGGLGLGVVILAVILGWRKFKTVAR
jgi:hypothetical protein